MYHCNGYNRSRLAQKFSPIYLSKESHIDETNINIINDIALSGESIWSVSIYNHTVAATNWNLLYKDQKISIRHTAFQQADQRSRQLSE